MVEQVLQMNKEKTVFWTLIGVLFISLCFYMFFINATVRNVVARQNLEKEANSLTLSIGSKEFEYISKRNTVDLTLAYSMGFKDVEVKEYIRTNSDKTVAFLSR